MAALILSFPLLLGLFFALLMVALNISGKDGPAVMARYSPVLYALLLTALLLGLNHLQPLPADLFSISFDLTMLGICSIAVLVGVFIFICELYAGKFLFGLKVRQHDSLNYLSVFHVFIFVVPVVLLEEVIWRFYLPMALLDKMNTFFVVMLCSLFFGLNHFFYGWQHIVLKAFYGFLWWLLFEVSGSIWAPVLSHAVFNLAVCLQGNIKSKWQSAAV